MLFQIPIDKFLLLAQQPGAGAGPAFLIPMVLIGILFYVMILRPENRKRAAHAQMLEALKKHDRIVTAGGIYGTVANASKGEDVTIIVDENSNTRLRILRSSISRVISAEGQEEPRQSVASSKS